MRTDIADDQRVTVRRRLCDDVRANVSTGSNAIVNHDRLAPRIRNVSTELPPERIGNTTHPDRHHDGKRAQAVTAYGEVLKRWPGHADALHYSGLALYQTGRLDVAAANIEHSLKIAPGSADAWCNLALVYQAQGSLDKAVAALREAI